MDKTNLFLAKTILFTIGSVTALIIKEAGQGHLKFSYDNNTLTITENGKIIKGNLYICLPDLTKLSDALTDFNNKHLMP